MTKTKMATPCQEVKSGSKALESSLAITKVNKRPKKQLLKMDGLRVATLAPLCPKIKV
jgi:hypothetical protein